MDYNLDKSLPDVLEAQPVPLQTSQVVDSSDSRLESYQALMEATFPPEELDSLEVTRGALENNDNPSRRADFIVILSTDEKGKVVGAMNASYIPALDTDGKPLGWSFVAVNYIATKPAARGRGVARDLYLQLDQSTRRIAAERKETVKYVVGETVNTVEGLVNKTGRSRLYFKKGEAWEEVQYEQVPLDWEEDGTPTAENVPLHLMGTPAHGGKTIPTPDLLRVVDGIYDYNSRLGAKSDCTPEGFKKANNHIQAALDKLATQLNGVDSVTLIAGDERDRLKQEGRVFYEHEGV